ncbi:hypothetical protein J6590_077972 [Homalodisca vitripennis]|nr:hypothetical protein J6590_077972 [Homalodisca vitripennis]
MCQGLGTRVSRQTTVGSILMSGLKKAGEAKPRRLLVSDLFLLDTGALSRCHLTIGLLSYRVCR